MDRKRIIEKIREINRLLGLGDNCKAKGKIPGMERYDFLVNHEIESLRKIFLENNSEVKEK